VVIFNTMVASAIDTLDSTERASIDPRLFTRIVSACASVAESSSAADDPEGELEIMQPPAMQYILAHLLLAGDLVWRPDLSFAPISEVAVDGKTIVAQFEDGCFANFEWTEPVRVARSESHAKLWNQHRLNMNPAVVRALHETYGG
jgi:hypothetical protein